jgi:pimeloyl-ACP methyl ester carboxylesterase
VLLVDLPGHGKSPEDGCDSIDEYRDAVYRALDGLETGACFVTGHSMGGAIAISLALAYPQLVKGLILVGTGAKLRVLPEILQDIKKEKERTVWRIVDLAFSPKADAALKQKNYEETMKCRAEVIYKDFNACDHFNVMDTAWAIKVPTLILCGTDDGLTPPKYSEYLHSQLQDSRLLLLEGAGHMVMWEKPERVNEAIEKFVSGSKT